MLRAVLRRKLRDAISGYVGEQVYVKDWYGHYPDRFKKLDEERRLIRLRIKQLSFERKQAKQND